MSVLWSSILSVIIIAALVGSAAVLTSGLGVVISLIRLVTCTRVTLSNNSALALSLIGVVVSAVVVGSLVPLLVSGCS